MTNELTFSVAMPEHLPEAERFFQDQVSSALSGDGATLKVDAIPWTNLWHYIQTMTLSKSGLDVSEVGTTWISSLADFNAPREFTDGDIAKIGGEHLFSDTAWKRATLMSDSRILSIPWLTDTRVIYYWRDMLASAGIETKKAFSTIEQTARTMATLHAAGIPAWGAPTFRCANNVHHVASWIWAKGADFVSPDSAHTTFCTQEAIAGIAAYFDLYRYMPRSFDSLDELLSAFKSKKVAAVMDGPWLLTRLTSQGGSKEMASNLGMALPPGSPFAGGSNLVIWNHISKDRLDAAITLIAQLISFDVQRKVSQATGLLPVRRELLDSHPYTTQPNYQVLLAAEKQGRHLPKIPMWGPMESSLVNIFGIVWQNIKTRGQGDLVSMLRQHLTPLATRFDRVMGLF